jgi:hypothetical protein
MNEERCADCGEPETVERKLRFRADERWSHDDCNEAVEAEWREMRRK